MSSSTPPHLDNTLITSGLHKRKRNSNLELYRIIVMLLIVAHHYVVNSGLIETLADSQMAFSQVSLLLFGAWGKTGINCFIMITGWFMCKSNISGEKLFKLYSQIVIYTIVIYCIFCISGHESFRPTNAILKFFPIKSISDSFISCFLLFYLLIPFINKLIYSLNKREHGILLCILIISYSVLPLFPAFNLRFNYVTWFSVLYLIAAYIRFYNFPFKISHNGWGWITLALIIMASISVIALTMLYTYGSMKIFNPFFFISDSNKLLALAIGVSSFMFFKDLKIPYSKLINIIGASTFGVLLIHANSDTMRHWLWQETVDSVGHFTDSVIFSLGYAALSVITIFIVCSGIDWFRGQYIEPNLTKWFNIIITRFRSK